MSTSMRIALGQFADPTHEMLTFARQLGVAHGLRNEMHFWLKELHGLVQCSHFSLARDQK